MYCRKQCKALFNCHVRIVYIMVYVVYVIKWYANNLLQSDNNDFVIIMYVNIVPIRVKNKPFFIRTKFPTDIPISFWVLITKKILSAADEGWCCDLKTDSWNCLCTSGISAAMYIAVNNSQK